MNMLNFTALTAAWKARLPAPREPFGDLDDIDRAPTDPAKASQLDALIQKTRNEVLASHFASRPANTTKNYAPKQKEWSVSLPPLLILYILVTINSKGVVRKVCLA